MAGWCFLLNFSISPFLKTFACITVVSNLVFEMLISHDLAVPDTVAIRDYKCPSLGKPLIFTGAVGPHSFSGNSSPIIGQ